MDPRRFGFIEPPVSGALESAIGVLKKVPATSFSCYVSCMRFACPTKGRRMDQAARTKSQCPCMLAIEEDHGESVHRLTRPVRSSRHALSRCCCECLSV
jgi:hypothetical protein